MSIPVKCKCGKVLNVPDSFAGKKGKCPHCKAVLDIPAKGKAPGAGGAPPRPPAAETKQVEYVEFRCPKTGKRARLPKALAGASVVCPICGEVHSISHSERMKDLISFSTVVKEEPAGEAAAEGTPQVCPTCGKPMSVAGERCVYCGAKLKTGSMRTRAVELTAPAVRTSASAVVAFLIAAAGVSFWGLGWKTSYTAVGVLAVLAGGWGIVAVRGAVRPTKGEWMGWASLACGLFLAVSASIAALMYVPAEARRLAPQENAEGLGEAYVDPAGSFTFRPPAGMKEVAASFVLWGLDPRAMVGMKGAAGKSLAVLSYYEPPRRHPSVAELEHLAHELTGSPETVVCELVDTGGIETYVVREMRYSENGKTASHVVHVLFHSQAGAASMELMLRDALARDEEKGPPSPEETDEERRKRAMERLKREYVISNMRFTPEYMQIMHEEALAGGGDVKPLDPDELEKERVKRIEEERESGRLSRKEARRLKEARPLSENELRGRVEEWARDVRRIVHVLYVHDLPYGVARRRRDSRKLIHTCAVELLVEVAAGEASAEDAADKFSDEVRFMARATRELGGEFPLRESRLRSWFRKLAEKAAEAHRQRDGSAKKPSRAKLAGWAASKAASSGLDRMVGELRRLDLNLVDDDDWVDLVMRSVSTFKFTPADESAGE